MILIFIYIILFNTLKSAFRIFLMQSSTTMSGEVDRSQQVWYWNNKSIVYIDDITDKNNEINNN